MKQFLIKVFFFISFFILIATLVIIFGYKSINNPLYFKLPENNDKIVFGHSHPECAFNDSLIENLSNLGSSGESYFYTYLKVKKIIPYNKQIKTVLIEFENSQIDKIMDSWTWDNDHINNNFSKYLPLLDFLDFQFLWQKNYKAILESSPKTLINELGFNFLTKCIPNKGIMFNCRFGGYRYLIRDKTDSLIRFLPIKNFNMPAIEISKTNIEYLSKIILFCKLNKVNVFLIRSPLHKKYNYYYNELLFHEIRKSNFTNVEFLDFKDFPLQNNQFGDLGHLNYKGSRVFSIFFNNLLDSGLLDRANKQDFINKQVSQFLLIQTENNSLINKNKK
jgi:hypothetical protein